MHWNIKIAWKFQLRYILNDFSARPGSDKVLSSLIFSLYPFLLHPPSKPDKMKAFYALSLLLATALAYPSGNSRGGNSPGGNNPGRDNPGNTPGGSSNGGGKVCPSGLYSNPVCCSADILGVADLDCKSPSSATSVDDFKLSCSNEGKKATCCAIPAVSYIPVNSCVASWLEARGLTCAELQAGLGVVCTDP